MPYVFKDSSDALSRQVWVLDEDAGVGRWTSAQPQSRVVDKSGRDAYLCAEYLWDGEYYVQESRVKTWAWDMAFISILAWF